MTHIQKTWKIVSIDGGVGSKCFVFDPRDEEPYTGFSDRQRSKNIVSTPTSSAPSSMTTTARDPCC